MPDICPKCGLPLDICACGALVKEEVAKIRVYTTKMKFGKLVTIVEGISGDEVVRTASELKRKLACGGTGKGSQIVLQGNHLSKVKGVLMKLGYNEKSIDMRG